MRNTVVKKFLVIIGNGFDLHHNMRTGYSDYRKYLINSGKKEIVDCFELVLEGNTDEESVKILWNQLEQVIGLLPYERAYPYLKGYGDENWSDSYHHDFQYEVEKMANYWPGIKGNLASWIKTVEYTVADESLKRIINENANYISFNYTNTLEKLYGINKEDICYIHGDACKEERLILGHRNGSYYPEWDDNNVDEDVRLLNAGVFMEKFRKETYKPIERILESNEKFNNFLSEYDYLEIFMIGLSYNDIDKRYIKEISLKQKIPWRFVCYGEDDFKMVKAYADDIGVNDYLIMTYNDICELYVDSENT